MVFSQEQMVACWMVSGLVTTGIIANISPGLVVMQPDMLRIISGFMDGLLSRFPTALPMSFNYVSLAMPLKVSSRAYPGLKNLINYSFMGFVFFVSKDSEIRSIERCVFTKNHLREPLVEF
jgi:hypothetical protein